MPEPKDQHDAQLLGIGKAPPELLARIFQASTDPSVIQGPGVGKDAAIVEWGDRALVVSSDPITFIDADAEAGKLAVTVNANDIFAVGAEPEWLLATILAPPGVPARDLETLLTDLQAACAESDITLIAGHTEVTDAVTRTIISCTMIGSAPLGQIIPSDAARNGDAIIQAGAAAVEGTAILGHPELLHTPGISIATAARALRAVEGLHAMHDVTEGGIATAALELAEAAGLSPALDFDNIIWLPETLGTCEERGLDPLGTPRLRHPAGRRLPGRRRSRPLRVVQSRCASIPHRTGGLPVTRYTQIRRPDGTASALRARRGVAGIRRCPALNTVIWRRPRSSEPVGSGQESM